MKLSAAFALFIDLRAAVRVALWPTLKDVFHNPTLIFHISRTFMSHVWAAFAAPTDENGRAVKRGLLPNATGVVLDIGAGTLNHSFSPGQTQPDSPYSLPRRLGLGHTAQYLDRDKVTTYVALEPNTKMHAHIRQTAESAGFLESDGSLVILSFGAEDTMQIVEALGGRPHPVDTIISVLTLCSIPSPERVMTSLVRDVLKPGGQVLFYEHVLSPRADVAWWQRFWTPLWRVFLDGCRLDCPTHVHISEMKSIAPNGEEVSMWAEGNTWGKPEEPEENLWWHQAGQFKKHE